MPRDDATLLDILRFGRSAMAFVQDMDLSTFLEDAKTQSAVLHQLFVLGEAVRRLSEEFRGRYPDIPWRLMAAMRNKVIHEYDEVDLDEVWKTVRDDLPRLVESLERRSPP